MSVLGAIQSRKSCRAFLNKGVNQKVIQDILEAAKWAPSGVNHQPTKVAVLGNETKSRLSKLLIERYRSGIKPNPDYLYCPKEWPEVYRNRRRTCALALYNSLSVSVDDLQGRNKHWEKNYHFFHAPVGLIVFIDRGMPVGSWIDAGMFIQNILLAAQEFGLASCPQAAFADYPDVVREVLYLNNVEIICGIALGYADTKHPINSYRIGREPLETFTSWYP